MSATRPDPDALLAEVTREEQKAKRGRLKIFFGASAGVGKTYAMLMAASQLRSQGIDVVVGLVETHGRRETAALLEGLELLPLKLIQHRGAALKEFDLDGALLRHPAVLLVDELAHSNAPGARHAKRWQDVEELLNAGIDVFSTINVQHIESLNDIVGGITGVRVWETIPDRIFDSADEVVLVDLPPDDLLQRLKEGKVYLPDQAERAVQNFFRKGNLIALRELALRRTADRVDDQMRSYRHERISGRVLQTREAVLACVGPSAGGYKTVRSASRLAAALDARWHAVYAETAALQKLPDSKRRAILEALKFAQDQGAVTATVPAQNAPAAIVDYARKIGLTTVVIGRPSRKGYWRNWGKDFAQRLSALAPDLEVVIVPEETQRPKAEWSSGEQVESDEEERRTGRIRAYAGTLAASLVTTLIALPLQPYFDLANIVMLFLLTVVLVAVQWGRGPAVMAAIVNVAAFDFFFVPPRLSFAVSDVQYLLTFAVLLAVGLITGQLTAGLRYQARIAGHREERARALYEMARELSSALAEEQVCEIADRFMEASFRAKVAILLPDQHEQVHAVGQKTGRAPSVDTSIAQWAFDRDEAAGIGTNTLAASPMLYLPLKAPVRNRGVLVIEPDNARLLLIPEQRRQLDTFATLIAIALERVHFVTVARDTLLTMESERLRNSLLSALSHDLRTPLTALVGLAESLALEGQGLNQVQADIVNAIHEQAVRMVQLVNNLLDMARLQSGRVQLRKEWQSVAELTGAALQSRREALARHQVKVDLPADLPLVNCDAALIERVLVNLLENAAKYTPRGSVITVTAVAKPDTMEVTVFDQGPGLPRGQEQTVFEKFVRGQKESGVPGVGLGLAICKAIVEAHGGEISAANHPGGGAQFTFTLPLTAAPEMPLEPARVQQ
jgi:two-component system sensor histidine kinase KdpD